MKAIQVKETGGPEKMELVDIPAPQPGPKQALVKIAASGVNFIDVYFRTGLYKADLPVTLGQEGAGVVEAVGPEVTEVRRGDRVAYAMARGSYAEFAVVPSWQLVKDPDYMGLLSAAAGGAGRLIVQMAKMRGARVLGTTSTEAKGDLARQAGIDEVIYYTRQDFEAEVKRLTDGRGVDVIYDSVGVTTFMQGLNCLRPRGMMVLFGQSGGKVPPLDPTILNTKGSLFLTRPSLAYYCATREELLWRAGDVLQWVASGKLKLAIERTYPLAQVAQAHRDLESRSTAGKLLLAVEGA